MKKIFGTLALFAALGLPLPAFAVQYDGIKNLSPSTRTYNLLNPTQTVSISPGQTVIIQDTQFTSSNALESDVASGYINQYVIGSPNSTQTNYTQPVTITSSSNAAAGLLISESAGAQPAISATQTNAGDIMDLYQSTAPELLFGNALFHLYTPAKFESNLTIGNAGQTQGQLNFGSSGSSYLTYTTTSGPPGVSAFNSGAFGFANGPISTNNPNGYFIGTYQVLNTDNTGSNTALHSQNGTFGFYNGGSSIASLNGTCLSIGGSCYGANATVGGNLTVGGSTSFNALAATGLTTPQIIGNLDLNLQPGDGTHNVNIRNSSGTTRQFFRNDGSFALASGTVTSDASGNVAAASLTAPTYQIPGAGQFSNVGGLTYLSSASGGGFQVRNSASTGDLIRINDNGSGTLFNNISFNNSGNLTANTLSSVGNTTVNGQLIAVGTLYGSDIYADRSANSGFIFLGNNGTHSIGYDGNQYIFGTGQVTLQGYLNVNSGINANGIQILSQGTANGGTNYNSNGVAFFNSTWNGSSAVSNNAYLIENTANQIVSSAPFVAPTLIGTTSITTPNISTSFITGNPILYLQTPNNASAISIGGNAVNFSTTQPVNVSGTLSVGGQSFFNSLINASSGISTTGNVSASGRLYAGPNSNTANSSTQVGDIIADRGDGTAQLFFGNNRNNYMYYNGSQYFLQGGSLNIPGGDINISNSHNLNMPTGTVTTYALNSSGSINANVINASGVINSNSGFTVNGQPLSKTYFKILRPVLNAVGTQNYGSYSATLSTGTLAGNSSQVYDIYAKFFAGDWSSSGGGLTPVATMTGSNGAGWEASSRSERDGGQQEEQTLDYIGVATGGQNPSVTLQLQYFALDAQAYMGAFTLEAIPR
jgi:hypothetical protein